MATETAKSPNIDFVHPDLRAVMTRYQMIADCLEGESAVKSAGDGGDAYLIRPNVPNAANSRPANVEQDDDGPLFDPVAVSEEQQERFRQLVARAVFYNVTQRTHRGLVGAVFKNDPVVTLPELLPTLEDDCDGAGVALAQQAEKAAGYALAYGRYGLLVDYPTLERTATRAEIMAGNIKPNIVLYDPRVVINWRTIVVGAARILSLVVIRETESVSDDGFQTETEPRWRVLRLVPNPSGEDGLVYEMSTWKQAEKGSYELTSVPVVPRDGKGKPFTRIPFTFGGAINNDPDVDLPPLADLAALNIAHYRNSADNEEMLHMCGQATPIVAGLTEDWARDILRGEVRLGSRGLVPLPAGGSAQLLQLQSTSAISEAMAQKERQMVALGAKLVEQKQIQRTATEAAIEDAAETSVLGSCVRNVASAYRWALQVCADFVGASRDSVDFELTADFEMGRMNPQEFVAALQAWQAKGLATSEFRAIEKRAGLATLDDEEFKAEVESEISYSTTVTAPGAQAASVAADENQPAE